MKKIPWRQISFFVVAFALIMTIPASVIAQPAPVESSDQPQLLLADAPHTMNYQGYLTNTSGVGYNGNVNIIANLYNASAAGSKVWGPETLNNVPVANGLFNIVIGATVVLYPDMFDEALFLELTINGTVMPRQPLHASAYAFGLVPGAEVDGTPGNSSNVLTVYNRSTDSNSRGIDARGWQYGIYAAETGSGDTGIYSPDYIHGGGFRSAADSYLFVPGISGISWDDPAASQLKLDPQSTGTMLIYSRAPGTGTRYFYLPITIPAVLFGQSVTVEEITLYYRVSNATSYIEELSLEKGTGANLKSTLYTTNNDLTSTTATSVTFSGINALLDTNSGWLLVRFVLIFDDNLDSIEIGGVRLRLGHQN